MWLCTSNDYKAFSSLGIPENQTSQKNIERDQVLFPIHSLFCTKSRFLTVTSAIQSLGKFFHNTAACYRGGIIKAPFVKFSIMGNWNGYLWVMFIFVRCLRRWAVLTPVKYNLIFYKRLDSYENRIKKEPNKLIGNPRLDLC